MDETHIDIKALAGLACVIMDKSKVLLGRRKGSHGEGTWSFPGGQIENGESFEHCFYRELDEKTGLLREDVQLINYIPDYVTNDFFEGDKIHYITLYFRGLFIPGGRRPFVKEPDKCEEWEWFEWGNLPDNSFLPIKNLMLQSYNPFDM